MEVGTGSFFAESDVVGSPALVLLASAGLLVRVDELIFSSLGSICRLCSQ